ncbi:MAG: hypothetical protein CM15mP47_5030 [Methanobacteriota archaeon]|nr:MAG: hypothetical protein CM15mP47_5030 [Euryarchaeota archaeon]
MLVSRCSRLVERRRQSLEENYVIPDDIKGIALQIISHRINMKPEAKIRGITGMHIVRKILSEVPVPVIQPM